MTKFVLLFIATVFVLGVANGARIPRDTPAEGADLTKSLEDAWKSLQKQWEQTFTKENMEKFSDDIKNFGDKIKTAGTEFVNKIEKKAEEVKN